MLECGIVHNCYAVICANERMKFRIKFKISFSHHHIATISQFQIVTK